MNINDLTNIKDCYSQFCGEKPIPIDSEIWTSILTESEFISIHNNDSFHIFHEMLQSLRLNTEKTHNLETFIHYLFRLGKQIDFDHLDSTNEECKAQLKMLTKGIYLIRIIIQYLFETCDEVQLPFLFGIPHHEQKDYKEVYSHLYITDIYGDTMVSFYLLLLNLVILYTPTTLSDDLYNEVLSLFIELFYKRRQSVYCSSVVSPFFSENFFIDLFMICGETFYYSYEDPWEVKEESFHQWKIHHEQSKTPENDNDNDNENETESEPEAIPQTWASELIYKLLSNITHTYQSTSTPSESTYISQFFYGLTHYLSSSSSTKSFSSLSTTMNSQNNEASSPTMKSLSSVVDQSLSSSITSNYICIYSEILLCLLTCIDVTTINPYKNILSLYKNNHKVKKDLHDTNTCLYISFSTLYEHLTSNILFEPNLICFYLLLLYVPAFCDYVISKNDSKDYLMNILHVLYLYSSNSISKETISILLSILLILSETQSFNAVLFSLPTKKPSWFVERQFNHDIHYGDILLCVLIHMIIYTINGSDELFILTTGFSLLLNTLQSATNLNSYTCTRLFDLLFLIKNKYLYLKESQHDSTNDIDESTLAFYQQYIQFLLQYLYILMISPNKEKNIALIYESLHRYLQFQPLLSISEFQSYTTPIVDLLDILNESLNISPNEDQNSPYTDENETYSYDTMLESLRKRIRLILPSSSTLSTSPCFIFEDTNSSNGFFNKYIRHIIQQYCHLLCIPI